MSRLLPPTRPYWKMGGTQLLAQIIIKNVRCNIPGLPHTRPSSTAKREGPLARSAIQALDGQRFPRGGVAALLQPLEDLTAPRRRRRATLFEFLHLSAVGPRPALYAVRDPSALSQRVLAARFTSKRSLAPRGRRLRADGAAAGLAR